MNSLELLVTTMSEWYHQQPKKTTSNDLVGKVLVLTSTPPRETSFSGMFMLEVKEKEDPYQKYVLMASDTDVSKAAELFVNTGQFTYKKTKKDDKYASVCAVK